ncbi:uncharacterized protein ACA1_020630 [Acanthamoeba castellanii str. Neff]|uniref:Uncharacterized protein n=1 Tax=Acanthamoeba castellanii (strain ATCC 30010 / Neff) TaxID=1257118 RepID=L8GN67_ACACF|nr:uncharacterized protein ACA1_020630 [Acanthamoeba castellanii str. Neff]ELR14188.1 hypothetical protein ACA1_020630 [Acanthamoeba castellanii str. Neff]
MTTNATLVGSPDLVAALARARFAPWPTTETIVNGMLVDTIERANPATREPFWFALEPFSPRLIPTLQALLSHAPRSRVLDHWDANPPTVARNSLTYVAAARHAPDNPMELSDSAVDRAFDVIQALLDAGYTPDEPAMRLPYPPTNWAAPFLASQVPQEHEFDGIYSDDAAAYAFLAAHGSPCDRKCGKHIGRPILELLPEHDLARHDLEVGQDSLDAAAEALAHVLEIYNTAHAVRVSSLGA